MKTYLVMTASALLLIAAGIVCTFLPKELAAMLGSDTITGSAVIIQIVGALYFAFGMVNWTAREALIGGVYGRPVAIGNLTHFTVGGLALIKSSASSPLLLAAAGIYLLFAVLFGIIFFRHPATNAERQS